METGSGVMRLAAVFLARFDRGATRVLLNAFMRRLLLKFVLLIAMAKFVPSELVDSPNRLQRRKFLMIRDSCHPPENRPRTFLLCVSAHWRSLRGTPRSASKHVCAELC